jgi:peptidoglycan/xylan/chitin deacetylase (PgdA/CDA1 family)
MDQEGFDIEAHSRTHPDLTRLNDTAAWNEIAGSKQDLERMLGHPVDLFAYPYGAVNAHVVALLQRAGFRGGILAGGGRSYSTSYPFAEPRIMVDRGDDLANFVAKVVGRPYRDTLNIGSAPNTTNAAQPKPEYHPAPAPVPTVAPDGGDAGNGGGASPPNGGGLDGGSTGSDPTSGPAGHGTIYV